MAENGVQTPINHKISATGLTEGLFYSSIDTFANATKILTDLIVGHADDRQAVSFQECGAFSVLLCIASFIML